MKFIKTLWQFLYFNKNNHEYNLQTTKLERNINQVYHRKTQTGAHHTGGHLHSYPISPVSCGQEKEWQSAYRDTDNAHIRYVLL